jgi:hypothetical protein
MARTNPGHVGRVVAGATAAEESEDRRQKGHQRVKIILPHTVERTVFRARAVLDFRDEYDLFGRANMCLGALGTNKAATSERNGLLKG